MKNLIYFLFVVIFISSCSSGKNALEKGNYMQAIEKAVNRLSSDPNNKNAKRVLVDGYAVAMDFYQEEIDQVLSTNDRLKWTNTLNIMEQVNRLSDLIRRVPAARKLIPSPKTYTSELTDVKNRAAEELYQEGEQLLQRETRDDAKQAYYNFLEADRLVPSYKDVIAKLNEAKELATLKVVIEPLPSPSMRFELTADFFYNQVMEQMNVRFPDESFVNFYSPNQAEQMGLEYPDMLVYMEFFDFFIGKANHYEEESTLSRDIEEEVAIQVSQDSTRYETKTYRKTGKIRVITDEVASGGLLEVKIEDYQISKLLLDDKIPGEYIWKNRYGIFVGDEEVLTDDELRIVNNRAILPPGSQDLFYEFTRPIYSQLTERLASFFRRYN